MGRKPDKKPDRKLPRHIGGSLTSEERRKLEAHIEDLFVENKNSVAGRALKKLIAELGKLEDDYRALVCCVQWYADIQTYRKRKLSGSGHFVSVVEVDEGYMAKMCLKELNIKLLNAEDRYDDDDDD